MRARGGNLQQTMRRSLSVEPQWRGSGLRVFALAINHTIVQLLQHFYIFFLHFFSFSLRVFSRMLSRVSQLTKQFTTTMSSTDKTPNINLYTTQTPNGIKISITLEELGFVPPVSSDPMPFAPCHIPSAS